MLRVDRLTCTYNRAIQALTGVSLTLNKGEVVGLLGPNGAGKTTTLRCITGEIRFLNGEIAEGIIEYNGKDISRLLPFEAANIGISLVPEDRKLFIDMTLHENLMMGAYPLKDKRLIKENYEKVFDYFPVLKDFRRRLAGYLSGGEQQMLAIARALMSSPQLLLLDEPSTGLAPIIISSIFEIIEKIRKESDVSILLVEQNASMALRVCNRCFILEKGNVVLYGESGKLKNDPRIKESYLGIS
jgi:branched-chain amino acid transport system ATP-binding protein